MVLDLFFIISAGYGFYLGFSKGIIKTVFTLLSIMFGLLAGFKFAPEMSNFLETLFNSSNPLMFIAGFLCAFVGTMLLIRLFARGLEGFFKTVNINIINQVAGGALLATGMVLLYSVVLWFFSNSHILDEETIDQSMSYEYVQKLPNQVWKIGKALQPTFEEFWDHTVEFMDEMQDRNVENAESDPTIFDIEDG